MLEQSIFGEAVHNASVAAYISRGDEVLALNDAVCSLTGYSRDEIVGGLARAIAADDESRRQGDEVKAGRRTSGSVRIVRKDGVIVRVSYLVAPTRVARDTLQLGLLWADATGES
ncbi:MAG TPA: PAS domain-containing protein [Gaiellaceae bacterium]|jgi:PAS domain S-box-containing protein|nr:PAS domain-containing protein [Gaiellaceae bacterium]